MWRDRATSVLSVLLVAALIGWFWVRGERFIATNGPTFDEGVHLTAGYSYWKTGDFYLNAEDPPLMKLLWAVPLVLGDAPPYPVELASSTTDHWQIADTWMYGSGASPRSLLEPARRINLAVGSCVVILAGWLAYRVWKSKLAGLATCAFAACDPNLLALSCIISTDVGLTFFALLTCYLMWEYIEAPSRGLLIATGIGMGLMLAAKFSAIGFIAGFGVAGLILISCGGKLALPGREQQHGFRPALDTAIRVGSIAAVTAAATYAFIHVYQWGLGFKFQLTRAKLDIGIFYLNGKCSQHGWYHYFIVALLVKLPLGLLIAVVISAATVVVRLSMSRCIQARNAKEGQASDAATSEIVSEDHTPHSSFSFRECLRNHNLWLVIPPLVFFCLASWSRVDMGLRVVLPVVPFLYLLASGLTSTQHCRLLSVTILSICLAWCGVNAVRANPHEITYFNELASITTPGVPILADSNLDWGQSLPTLKEWMSSEGVEQVYLAYFGTDQPEAYGIRYQHLPCYGHVGTLRGEIIPLTARRHIIAVSANHLLGLYLDDPYRYAWLRNRQPIAVLDGSIHIFDLTADPEAIARVRGLTAQ